MKLMPIAFFLREDLEGHQEKWSVFTCVSKIISFCFGFALLRYAIGVKTLAPLFHPIRSKTKTNRDSLHRFSRASRQLHVRASSFDWLTGFSVCFVIGQNGFFGFGFTTLENRYTLYSSQVLCHYTGIAIEYDTDHSPSTIQLTHCASVQFKSEGDVDVECQRQDDDLLHVFSFKVVSHNCIRVVVPLKPLEIQYITRNSYELHLGPVHTAPEKFEIAILFLRLGPPSTLIRGKNGAFRKRSSSWRNFKTPTSGSRLDQKHCENGDFRNR